MRDRRRAADSGVKWLSERGGSAFTRPPAGSTNQALHRNRGAHSPAFRTHPKYHGIAVFPEELRFSPLGSSTHCRPPPLNARSRSRFRRCGPDCVPLPKKSPVQVAPIDRVYVSLTGATVQ